MKTGNHIKKNLLLLSFLFIIFPQLDGQTASFKFDYLSSQDGLSQVSVNCIVQDSVGFLWFGTQNGLNRYDGYEFEVFKHHPFDSNSLSHDWAQVMVETEPGVLWIGTLTEGLNRFDTINRKTTRYRHTPGTGSGLSDNRIRALCKDSIGSLWIGTQNGLNRLSLDSNQFQQYLHNPEDPTSISDNDITSIYQDSNRNLWVGTLKGLNRYDRQSGGFVHFFNHTNDPESLSGNKVMAITGDRKGNLWIGTRNNGLNRFIPVSNRFEHFKQGPGDPNSLCSNVVTTLLVDSDGNLWVGTGDAHAHGNGLSRLTLNSRTGKWEVINYSYKSIEVSAVSAPSAYLSAPTILSMCEDRGGNLWFGTYQKGLNKLSKRRAKFRHYAHIPDNSNSLSDNTLLSLHEDAKGIVWIGTHSGGLNRFDRENQQFTHYRHNPNDPTSIGSDSIWAIFSDHSGKLWIGTGNAGLNRFDPETNTFTRFTPNANDRFSISSSSIQYIMEDRTGYLWVGTWYGGLNLMDRKTKKFYHYPFNPESPRSNETVMSIYEDKQKILWLCTYGQGLVKATQLAGDGEKTVTLNFHFYRHIEQDKTSISSDDVLTILETGSGDLWLGTSYGLNHFNRETGTFTHFSEADGLCNNMVYGIIEHGEDLWLSTNYGLSQFNTRTLKFRNYDTGDGLQAMEFNQGAFLKSRSGEIFFGGLNGFNVFLPGEVPHNPHKPPIVITRFTKFDRPVNFSNVIYAMDEIHLTYKDRFFSFEFAALDFENPGKNRYAYKLEGFNHDWIECGSRRYASFTNLTGGEFTFRVRGSNNDGIWNEKGTAIHIHITPPPYQTWWFRGLVALLVLGLFFLVHKSRTRRVRQRMAQERLENELKLKTDFTAMLVHDLRNPLQCIVGYTDLLKDTPDPAGIQKFSGRIKRSSATMLKLINDMLDISKIEAGKMVIDPEQTNLVNIIKENMQLMQPLMERNQNRFESYLDPLPPILADRVRISQVINNLLANAIKFSPKNGVITIAAKKVREDNQEFQEITVADQGPGIAPERQGFIFSKYAQIENKSELLSKGTGLGLAVARLIVEAHQGIIGYREAMPTGSVFFFRIPSKDSTASEIS